jgi:hypothetical protein
MRNHDVSDLTANELERAKRQLTANLALARPDSPARVPILAHISAIDTELAGQAGAGRRPAGSGKYSSGPSRTPPPPAVPRPLSPAFLDHEDSAS